MLKSSEGMAASFEKAVATFDHNPLLHRVDRLVVVGEEQIDLRRVLLQSRNGSCRDDSQDARLLEGVIIGRQGDKTASDQSL